VPDLAFTSPSLIQLTNLKIIAFFFLLLVMLVFSQVRELNWLIQSSSMCGSVAGGSAQAHGGRQMGGGMRGG